MEKMLEQVVTPFQEGVAHTAEAVAELTTVNLSQLTRAHVLADAEL
jgi:hypothetical protein